MTQPIYESPCLSELFQQGLILQNLPSILVGHALDVSESHNILDMCAMPVGKTTHIASLSNYKANIIALDRSRQKIERFIKNNDLQSLNIKAYVCDSTSCVLSKVDSTRFLLDKLPKSGSKIKGLGRELFDRILMDGPCSALGQRPSFSGKCDPAMLRHYPSYQRSLLHAAHALLKPGGRMVFSTCTFTVGENEMNVKAFLEEFSDMKIVEPSPMLKQAAQGSRIGGLDGVCRFDPHLPCAFINGNALESIGFFYCIFKKAFS
jgi:methyltransferase NSUN6